RSPAGMTTRKAKTKGRDSGGESEDGSPVKTCAEGGEDDWRGGGGGGGGAPLGCGDEERGGGGVAVAGDVREEAFCWDLECRGYFADEVHVGLMHEEDGDIGGLEIVLGEKVFDGAGDFARGLNDDVETFHLDGAVVVELESFGVVAVGEEDGVIEAKETFFGGDDGSSCSVAEKNGRV